MVSSMPEKINSAQYALQARDLVKRYKGENEPALNGLSLFIRPGEILGLLGPNGAGKTTAISIMTTLLRPDRGNVAVYGDDINKRPALFRKMIGLVPQNIALYQEMTVRENLLFFGRLHGLGSHLQSSIEEVLALVAIESHADKIVATCSGGIQRRANLAAGLIHSPKILFLDEPTVGIDAQSRQLILERLIEKKRNGMALIYTTHYMEEVQQICDRVIIIDRGKSVATDSPAHLLTAHSDCTTLQDLFLKLTGKMLRD